MIQLKNCEIQILRHYLGTFKPEAIIELGSGYGESARILSEFAPCISFDTVKKHDLPGTDMLRYIIGDYKTHLQSIKTVMQQNKTFIFCDNGNKPQEVLEILKIETGLKKEFSNLIFTHDYPLEFTTDDLISIGLIYPFQTVYTGSGENRLYGLHI